jgi:hypothetical protein
MCKKIMLLSLLVLSFCPVFGQNSGMSKQDIEKAIRSTDVERKVFADTAVINLYQGNGVFGTSYGALGLQIDPTKNTKLTKYGKTEYLNMNHFVRAKFAADYLGKKTLKK